MDIVFLLVPVSALLVVAIGLVFWRAVENGQFDDLEAPARQVLADEDRPSAR